MAQETLILKIQSSGAEKKLERLQNGMEGFDKAARKTRGDLRPTSNGIRSMGNSAKGAAGSVQLLNKALGTLSKYLAVGALVGSFFKGFGEANKAKAALRTLGADAEALADKLLDVSTRSGDLRTQTDLLVASYDVVSAGFVKASDAAAILEASLDGAVGGLSTVARVSDAATSVLNAYGLEADQARRLIDGFIQTQNDGKIVVDQYARQIGRLAPMGKAAGVSIEELNAAISTISASGLPVEQTFTGLGMALAGIMKPSGDALEIAKALGIEFNATALKTKGFAGLLMDVAEKTGGNKEAMVRFFGSMEAVKAVLPLMNDGLEKYNKNLENQANSSGAAEKAAEIMGGTVTTELKKIINGVGNLARALDEFLAPVLNGILSTVSKVINEFTTLISMMNDSIIGESTKHLLGANTHILLGEEFMAAEQLSKSLKALNDISNFQSEEDIVKIEKQFARIADAQERLGKKLMTGLIGMGPRGDNKVQEMLTQQTIFMDNIRDLIKAQREEWAKVEQGVEGTTGVVSEQWKIAQEFMDGLKGGGEEVVKIWRSIGNEIKSGVVDGIKAAITGAKTFGEVLSNVLSRIADKLLNLGIDSLFTAIGGGGGFLGKLFGKTKTPAIKAGGLAEGGFATSPMVSSLVEKGEPEYVIPSGRMAEATSRYQSGRRGSDVIPRGGGSSSSSGGSGGSIAVSYNGPLLSFNQEDYVPRSAVQEIINSAASRGAKAGEARTMSSLRNSRGARARIGI